MSEPALQPLRYNDLIYPVTVESRFGDIVIEQSNLLSLPEGIYGFEEYTNFGLVQLPSQNETLFYVLQCLDEVGLIFLLTPLKQGEESIILADHIEEAAGSLKVNPKNCDFYAITTAKQVGDKIEISLNLKAPIIVERNRKIAWQFVLEMGDYPLQYSLDYNL